MGNPYHSVNPHPVNYPRLTQTTDDLLEGLIALRLERATPDWKLRASGIAPLSHLISEQRRRQESHPQGAA
jgi:hypothetical protein